MAKLLRELDRADRAPAHRPRGRGRRRRGTIGHDVLVAAIVLVLLGLFVSLAPGTVPAQARRLLGIGGRPLGHPPTVPDRGTFAFLAHQPSGPDDPVAYDPCREIRVQLNPAGGPDDALALTRTAIARIRRATGLHLLYDGTTDRRPQWNTPYLPSPLHQDEPVLVSFATPREVPALAGRVAGIGGSVPLSDGTADERYVTGGVTLDSGAFRRLARRPDGRRETQAIVLHEFGHLVGLAHVDDPKELMYHRNVGLTHFGPGDLAGLARLGAGRCF